MGGLFSRLFSSGKKLEACIVGLENSGKSTFLNILSVGHPVETFPTVGLNVKMVKKAGVSIKAWDIGGQQRFRAEWGRYTQGCDVIVFCVDAHDFARIKEACTELHRLLEDRSLNNMPLMICLNKIDLEPHMSKEECIRDLQLAKLNDNPWVVIAISALRQTNIEEAVTWLTKHGHS